MCVLRILKFTEIILLFLIFKTVLNKFVYCCLIVWLLVVVCKHVAREGVLQILAGNKNTPHPAGPWGSHVENVSDHPHKSQHLVSLKLRSNLIRHTIVTKYNPVTDIYHDIVVNRNVRGGGFGVHQTVRPFIYTWTMTGVNYVITMFSHFTYHVP